MVLGAEEEGEVETGLHVAYLGCRPPPILVQVSTELKHLSHGDRRKSWGSGLVCWAPKLPFREGDREGTGIERDPPGDLCTDNSHYVSK